MEYIEIGKIVNTQGLKGEVKMYSYTDNPQRVINLKKIYIEKKEYIIEKIRENSNMFVLKLKGFDRIEDTKVLMNKEVERELKEDEINDTENFFVKDLVGILVYDEEDKLLGELKEVFQTGANDVYSIITPDNKQILIPAISKVVLSVDIKAKKMVIHLMKGLE